jgi:hypothetical protein
MKRYRALVLLSVAGAALGVPATGPAAQSKCSARHSTTILQNSKVRVFKLPTSEGVRGFDVYACYKASGATRSLGASISGDYPFLPPAMALAGPVIGYADEECDEEYCASGLSAIDLNGSYAAEKGHRLAKVGSLRVTRRGSLIWIACPEKRGSRLTGSREPTCVRPGARDGVYLSAAPAGTPLKRLDRGRTIYPGSLRLKAGRATWRHGRRYRHAKVP